MDLKKISLLVCIAAVSLVLLIRWNAFQEKNQADQLAAPTSTSAVTHASATKQHDAPVVPHSAAPAVSSDTIHIKTDVLDIVIDPLGGDIVDAALLKYSVAIDKPDEPFRLLMRTDAHTYIAQSGLVGESGTDTAQSRPLYQAEKHEYVLADNQNELSVLLTYHQPETGAHITKEFVFTKSSYLVAMKQTIKNGPATTWRGLLYAQIKRDDFNPVVSSGFGIAPFLGMATTTPEKHYIKEDLSKLADKAYTAVTTGGWIAMVQHYFISAWVADVKDENHYYAKKQSAGNNYLLGYTGPEIVIPANEEKTVRASFYVGPKDVKSLETIAPFLDLTIDFGWLWWLAKPVLLPLMKLFHGYFNNWGWAIVGLTAVLKLIFLWPSTISYKSMANMRRVQPQMARLKDECGDNRQKMQEELMKLYKTEKINPLGGCLPMIIQMPVFLALYWMLMESVELRHAPFMGWVVDLSVRDPYFILPLLMGATMIWQQRLNPAPTDPTQAQVMKIMPWVFTGLFLFFPAGLVLYWLVNNIINMTHQGWITYKITGTTK